MTGIRPDEKATSRFPPNGRPDEEVAPCSCLLRRRTQRPARQAGRLVPPASVLGEEQATRQECLSLLRTTATKSGFHLVTPFRQRWQAKVSARGKQRSLGVFDSPEDAALEVLLFYIGQREPPASPTKPRNKRGEGRRPDSRHGMRKGSVRRAAGRWLESPASHGDCGATAP